MDKKQILKYALIAVAAYIVWRYVQNQGGLQGLLGGLFGAADQPALPPGAQPQAPGAQPQAPGAQPQAPGAPVIPAVPSDMDLMAAAYDSSQAGKTGGYRLNFHQWNWYRMQAAIQATGRYEAERHQPQWDGAVNPETQVTAAEYQARLAERGLAGMSGWSSGYAVGGSGAWKGAVQ